MASARSTTREPLARTDEVAEFLGKSVKTLQNWRSQGIGPPYTGTGRGIRYRWPDVEKWLKDQTVQPAA